MPDVFRAPRTEKDLVLRTGEDPPKGVKFYGTKCKKCGEKLRYVSNLGCVTCKSNDQALWDRRNSNRMRLISTSIARAYKRYESW